MNSKVPRYAMRLLRNNSPISSSSSSSSSSIISARATASTRAICSAQLSIHPLPSDALHSSRKQLPPKETLKFGKTFAPHMLQVHFNKDMGGWQSPTILPFQELKLSPASAALHYGKCVMLLARKAIRRRRHWIAHSSCLQPISTPLIRRMWIFRPRMF
jgi:hypothetical protein